MLTRLDQEALLATVLAHLEENGCFAFETRNPRQADLVSTGVPRRWFTYTSVAGHTVVVTGTQQWDPISQIIHWTTYRRWWQNGAQQSKTTRIATRFCFPQELLALLHYNGFGVSEQYGDWDHSPLSADSPSIISVCRRRR